MFGITANHANAQYLTADLGGDTTNVQLIRFPGSKLTSPYVMIDAKSAVKLANPKNPSRWVEELMRAIRTNNNMNHVWSTIPDTGKGAIVAEWKIEDSIHYLNIDNVIDAIEYLSPSEFKPNAGILRDLEREVLKNF